MYGTASQKFCDRTPFQLFFRGIIPLFPIKNSNFVTITTNYLKYGGFELHNYKGKKRARK